MNKNKYRLKAKTLLRAAVFAFAFFYFDSRAQSQTRSFDSISIPPLLEGVWQGKDRFILFDGESSQLACVLRLFYGRYDDRSAEPLSFSKDFPRDKNDASSSEAQQIQIHFSVIAENTESGEGVFELEIKYPNNKKNVYVPLAVKEGEAYLDFFTVERIRQDENSQSTDFFLRPFGASSGITICPPVIKNEVAAYYVNGQDAYKIRYWICEQAADFSQKCRFGSEGKTFFVDKFLFLAGNAYTCATGRRSDVRNTEKIDCESIGFVYSDFVQADDSTNAQNEKSQSMIFTEAQPYLVKLLPSQDDEKDRLIKITQSANSKKPPQPEPIFPPSQVNFHWKEISELEKYNPYTWNRRNADLHK